MPGRMGVGVRLTGEVAGFVAAGLVGLVLGGLLVGYEPVGGDPDRIFRPIKQELARALAEGRLPLWSDRMGLGVPLVAESHAAAFYPPNWAFYRALSVPLAYRLSMWLHFAVISAATYAYARRLGATPWGSALAGVAFALCGFLTVHSSHEWAYHALAYLPLCLMAADVYAETGRPGWLAGLALLWGVQIAVGHFQVQMWTGGLTLLTGVWRIVADGRPKRRVLGLVAGLAWGGAVAAAQLGPTWELAQLVGQTSRDKDALSFYSYPPAHLAELVVPGLFRNLRGGPEATYWYAQKTSGFEACLFVGTLPLALACVGYLAGGRGLSPWRVVVPLALATATMPRWWPEGYQAILDVPGLGYFRCPARYTAVASFGLALLAGKGLDRTISAGRFRAGFLLACGLMMAGFGWALWWSQANPGYRVCLDDTGLLLRLALAAAAWIVALAGIGFCRVGKLGPGVLVVLTAAEMAGYFYLGGTTRWGRAVDLPAKSPVLTALPKDARVGGALDNLPLRAGLVTMSPYTGFPLLPPYAQLKVSQDRRIGADPVAARWLSRYGVTHLVWDAGQADAMGKVILRKADPALDVAANRPTGLPEHRQWRIIALDPVAPPARVALKAEVVPDWVALIQRISETASADSTVWFLAEEAPASARTPRAHSARIVRWSGLSGEVEHDGACDLVLLIAWYPGWRVRINDGPEQAPARADAGLVSVRLDGRGVSRVSLTYRPTSYPAAPLLSAAAVAAALVTMGWRPKRNRPPITTSESATDPSAIARR